VALSVQVPALNDYKYRVVAYSQPITMYPGKLGLQFTQGHVEPVEVTNEQEFVAELKRLLASDEVVRLLRSLLVQVNAA